MLKNFGFGSMPESNLAKTQKEIAKEHDLMNCKMISFNKFSIKKSQNCMNQIL